MRSTPRASTWPTVACTSRAACPSEPRSRATGRSFAGPGATSSSAACRRSSCARTARFAAAGDPAAAATASWSMTWTIRAARADGRGGARRPCRRRERRAEGWLIATDGWRGVGEERRYLKALRATRTRPSSSSTTPGRSSAGSRSPATPPGEPARRRPRADGRRHAPPAGHRPRAARQAVDWARESGVRKLELHVFPWNEPAIRLYETYGFEREGRTAHYVRDGQDVDAVLMAYRVQTD